MGRLSRSKHANISISFQEQYPEPEDDRVISLESPPNEEGLASPWDVVDDRTTFLKGLWTKGLDLTPEEYDCISVEDLMKGALKRYGSQGSAADVNADLRNARVQEENRPHKRPTPSSAYDTDFQVKLAGSQIHFLSPKSPSKPGNLELARHYISKRRASLSAENFGEEEFQSFVARSDKVRNEATVMQKLVPIIVGKDDHIETESGVIFRNFKPVTAARTVHAMPDFYDGAFCEDLAKQIRKELTEFVSPAASGEFPIVPNFYFEGKRPRAAGTVAELQVLHEGALGARCSKSTGRFQIIMH